MAAVQLTLCQSVYRPKDFSTAIVEGLDGIVEALGESHEMPLTPDQWATTKKKTRSALKGRLPLFSFAEYDKSKGRTSAGVLAVHGIALDLDDGSLTLAEAMAKLPFACVGYSTPSHTPEKPKSRILVPFTEAIPPEDFEVIFEWAQDQLGGVLDPSTKNSDRAYYTRAHLQGVEPLLEVQDGPWLVPGEIIKEARKKSPGRSEGRQRAAQLKSTTTRGSLEDIEEMLGAIPSVDRSVWLRVCHGLKSWAWEAEIDDDAAFEVFDAWSASTTAGNYDPEANIKLWESSDPERSGGVTLGSLVELAREAGWRGRLPGIREKANGLALILREQPGELTTPGPLSSELPLSDTSMALWFTDQNKDQVRYCHAHASWYLWDNKKWAQDICERVMAMAISSAWALAQELRLGRHQSADREKEVARFLIQMLDRKRLTNSLKLAQPMCVIQVEQFDRDPWLLNCDNGTIDLRTGELRPHRPEDWITKITPVAYDPDATCPRWLDFLSQIAGGDEELVAYLQRVVGYSLTGRTSEHCLFLLHGIGANGKSTFLDTLRALMGPYAMQVQADSLMTRRSEGPRPDIARLAGARLVTASESEANQKLAEGLVKQLTGGDAITARFLYQREFEFDPEFKLFLATNRKPAIEGTDEGIWRRIHLIPFEVTFAPDQRDKDLPQKLKEELEGILAWVVQGSLEWQQVGLQPPTRVLAATAEYRGESDVVGHFLEDCTKTAEDSEVSSKDLYYAYVGWCRSNGEEGLSKPQFGQRLKERGVKQTRTKRARGWSRLALLEDTTPFADPDF